jgi:hypothetical protein
VGLLVMGSDAEDRAARALAIKIALQSGPRVIPSRVDTWPQMWVGDRAPNSRWTVRQLAKLKSELEHAMTINSGLGRAIVRKLRDPDQVEGWWMELTDGSKVECPLLATSKRRPPRILIITPGGDKIWREATHD